MDQTEVVTRKKKENGLKRLNHWWTLAIIIIALITGIICAYFYYRTPVFKYPKKIETYELDRKCLMTPDSAYSIFLKAVHENNPDLMRVVVTDDAIKEYAIKYYKGVIYDYWVQYMLERTNADIVKEYGKDWYDNVQVEGISKVNTYTLSHAEVEVTCNGKPFTFKYKIQGFNNRYRLEDSSIQELFDIYMYDDENRPSYIYNDFIR